MVLVSILVASILVSLSSLVGIFTLGIKKKLLDQVLFWSVALSAGALLGGAFLHLLPEAAEHLLPEPLFLTTLLAFLLFFLVEKVLHWHHCHQGNCDVHTFGHMNLLGDGVHNFIDGLIIAGSFMTSIKLGWITTLAVALHEIPQEIGDFGVLLYAGWHKKKALWANFIVALTALLGAIVGYILSGVITNLAAWLMPLAAGGFIYIGASDLIPEIRHTSHLKTSVTSFIFFIIGLVMMYLLKLIK